jgi:6-pyruvoyltetrahydropterin/6-carboxytetrahydropterin synthase
LDVLIIKELTISAAHYLPGHPKCGHLHGHTYFIRNLSIRTEAFVDFGDIKSEVNKWDHKLLVPKGDATKWLQIGGGLHQQMRIVLDIVEIDSIPTVEDMARDLQARLEKLPGVASVSFELYEGPNLGVAV